MNGDRHGSINLSGRRDFQPRETRNTDCWAYFKKPRTSPLISLESYFNSIVQLCKYTVQLPLHSLQLSRTISDKNGFEPSRSMLYNRRQAWRGGQGRDCILGWRYVILFKRGKKIVSSIYPATASNHILYIVPAYITYPKDKSTEKAIFFLPDVIGYKLPNAQLYGVTLVLWCFFKDESILNLFLPSTSL